MKSSLSVSLSCCCDALPPARGPGSRTQPSQKKPSIYVPDIRALLKEGRKEGKRERKNERSDLIQLSHAEKAPPQTSRRKRKAPQRATTSKRRPLVVHEFSIPQCLMNKTRRVSLHGSAVTPEPGNPPNHIPPVLNYRPTHSLTHSIIPSTRSIRRWNELHSINHSLS
ncbi:hypothetical protein Mp_3g05850 [Marchantia polymorpha subsp. ruderalis]|uniref:Uncharacterized protein n=2 Tax=Marchantia polymorpha TaxID=3197 RepID=A0AAF6AXU5_MARPO|nr:hypothetical protein MARPO_0006s0056 [Marchantia polymorpha]BBN04579.1 hypothetical protein Mp_3g05850 [Marchantia polymorpha subsp. ruderalis]|eukprot:PTQ48016.1 hypothetical protein MARPO_0006s0056 [Marchantia polymorpha]